MNQNAPSAKPAVFRRFLWRLLLTALVIYLLVLTILEFNQRVFIYHPPVFTAQQVDDMARLVNLARWTNPAGSNIGLKRLSPKQPADGQVLVVYGNASHTAGSAHYATDIQRAAAFDVFILEYPGFADRPGSPSQKSLFAAAEEAFQLLATNKPIYLVGESLGTGVAAYLAGTHPGRIDGLLLVSPYNNLTDVAQKHMPIFPVRLMLIDRFPSEDYLRNYHGKIGITVDGRDTVVPEKFGLRLYNGYAGPKQIWEFPQEGHAAIGEPPEKFWKEVLEFWQNK